MPGVDRVGRSGPHRGWAAPGTLGCFAGAAVCLAALARYAPQHEEALIDLRVFRSPARW
ncbi:hypothetical protein [Nocardia brasiliensis]|uniref:hypothetical protein n=1 Tax=Nocardia brasiliensis TaxID=37326 RepID=UPI0002FC44AB|nr:hypothetical protein [Nocardia brasiliensis]